MEILLTISILGVAMVALISSMTLGAVGSDRHRRLSDTELIARSFAEVTKNQALRPTTTALSAAVAVHNPGDTIVMSVTSSTGFPATPFDIAVDTEEFTVSSNAGTVWTTTARGTESHASGATVTRYDACPTSGQLMPSPTFTVPATARNIGAPTIDTTVEFFDTGGAPISGSCGAFWSTPPSPCALLAPQEHLTECDPPLLRATIRVASTDTDARRSSSTSTQILIRRGNG